MFRRDGVFRQWRASAGPVTELKSLGDERIPSDPQPNDDVVEPARIVQLADLSYNVPLSPTPIGRERDLAWGV